jgi:hypothetical protein
MYNLCLANGFGKNWLRALSLNEMVVLVNMNFECDVFVGHVIKKVLRKTEALDLPFSVYPPFLPFIAPQYHTPLYLQE